jgi:Vacuolar sorting-associated protein 13, N-terminal
MLFCGKFCQISIQRVHIRYEDTVSCIGHATACGIMLQEMSVETTDEQWKPEWVGGNVPVVHKVQHGSNFQSNKSYLLQISIACFVSPDVTTARLKYS